jgi:hypothetical protein
VDLNEDSPSDEEVLPGWSRDDDDDNNDWDFDESGWCSASDDDDIDAEDDLRQQVQEFARDNENISHYEPLPSAEQGKQAVHKEYQFCPPSHRLSIMHLFAKHASLHSLLPERHGEKRTPELIYRDAVTEMYRHCEVNNLTEVWAYLWNSWYSPSRWPLWTRAAHAKSIPVHRTTMMVEALWRNLKRLVLHMYNRPPADLAVHALVTKSIPPYRHTLSTLISIRRGGRPQALTHMQEAFKRAWEHLLTVPIKGTYTTNIMKWTCDCGAQKYHAYLLCKHLVHAAGRLPSNWWATATRFHVPPFYTVPIEGQIASPPERNQNRDWNLDLDSDDESTSSVVSLHHPVRHLCSCSICNSLTQL